MSEIQIVIFLAISICSCIHANIFYIDLKFTADNLKIFLFRQSSSGPRERTKLQIVVNTILHTQRKMYRFNQ